ncbi:MAG: hypothetical protein GWO08_01260, partial [Gammaproteobacteria bacterium]|nr:hypothetical protein [Gammaproteobacteria bacterium]NIU12491.1 hypothetical protein [candidate division Zixibacteria bacterium]NIW43263.1 hypothetical protein [Gammaproteobacteria bacterium]
MDQERRIFFHKPAVAGVRLYHPALDTTLQATIEEWSPAGVRIACETLNI